MKQSPFSNLPVFLQGVQDKKSKALKTKGLMSTVEMDRKNMLDLNILVGVDCSGSISVHMFSTFMKQLEEIKGMSRVKVVEVGSDIRAIYDFEYTGARHSVVRLQGGGGNGEHIFFPLAQKMKPDAILYMTDGYCVSANNPKIPTGFILTRDGVMPYSWGTLEGRLPT